VVDEDRLQDLRRQRPELRRHLADHHGGVLDEIAPLRAQAVVVEGAARRGEALVDARAARGGVQNDEPLP